MKYAITYSPEAKEGLAKLKRSEPASYKKAVKTPSSSTKSIIRLISLIGKWNFGRDRTSLYSFKISSLYSNFMLRFCIASNTLKVASVSISRQQR